jgi:hypothetical protein
MTKPKPKFSKIADATWAASECAEWAIARARKALKTYERSPTPHNRAVAERLRDEMDDAVKEYLNLHDLFMAACDEIEREADEPAGEA